MIEFSNLEKMPQKLAQMQAEITNPTKDSTGMHNAKYAQLDTVIESIKPKATKHGFSIIQLPYNDGEVFGVETMLLHESGEYIKGRYGSRLTSSNPQDYGKAITYYRRYALGALFNIAPEDDDDGDALRKKHDANKKPTAKQLNAMYYKVKDNKCDMDTFNNLFKLCMNVNQYKWLMDNFSKENFDKLANKLREEK